MTTSVQTHSVPLTDRLIHQLQNGYCVEILSRFVVATCRLEAKGTQTKTGCEIVKRKRKKKRQSTRTWVTFEFIRYYLSLVIGLTRLGKSEKVIWGFRAHHLCHGAFTFVSLLSGALVALVSSATKTRFRSKCFRRKILPFMNITIPSHRDTCIFASLIKYKY